MNRSGPDDSDGDEPFQRDTRSIGEGVVSEFLWARGLDRIDYLLPTHADADHTDGLNDVARNFKVRGAIVARTPPDAGIGLRLLAIEEQVDEWLTAYQPDAVAVERVFSQHNVRTVMGTAQAGAVAIVCAARRGLPVALHTPSEVKAAVTGSGRADKAQVTAMVMRLLRLTDPPRPADTADALALAICHLWRGGTQDRIAAAASLMERRLAAARGELPDQLAAARRERNQRQRGTR